MQIAAASFPFPVIFFIAFIAIAIGMIIYSYLNEKKRTQAWKDIAEQLGFTYSTDLSELRREKAGSFKLFSHGRSHRVRNLIEGENGGIKVILADYSYVTGSGKNSTTHNQTVCLLQAGALRLPHFYLCPEIRLFSFLQTLFSGKDIDFDDDPEFSNMFILQGENEEEIRNVFSSGVRRTLATQENKQLTIEGLDDVFLIHNGKRIDVTMETVQNRIALAFSLMNTFQEAQA